MNRQSLKEKHPMIRRPVLLALMTVAFCLAGSRMVCCSEVTDLKGKLEALENQMDQEKDKAKKEDLKKQGKQLEGQLKAAQEREKVAAKAGNKDKAEKGKTETATASKSEAQGLNKFARFWTEDVGKPMRKFFHGN
jgi:predicted nucleotidyltransferase